ncbi:MAG TPA: hypothetical protein PKA64_12505, partial [Myxococcota bacterium]|nr:hypothetical protein [Myxococcota bacterium]
MQSVLLSDEALVIDAKSDEFAYTQDLGLARRGPEGAKIVNPIYREVLVRQLTVSEETSLPAPWWRWCTAEGKLAVPALIHAFLHGWRENSDILRGAERCLYHEAAHLAFMGFLQRVIHGGGTVQREHAAARGRVEVVVTCAGERHAFALKRVSARSGLERVVDDGIEQFAGNLDTLGLDAGWLIVFDLRPGRTWEERPWTCEERRGGRRLHPRGPVARPRGAWGPFSAPSTPTAR